uniref:uncharacterized protein isoform X2 n=1 Tax=Myxine glutinosa TaxID=7769 RepID=UPI00358DFA92
MEDMNFDSRQEKDDQDDDSGAKFEVKDELDIEKHLNVRRPRKSKPSLLESRCEEDSGAKFELKDELHIDQHLNVRRPRKSKPSLLRTLHKEGEPKNIQKIPCTRCCLKFTTEASLELHSKRDKGRYGQEGQGQ